MIFGKKKLNLRREYDQSLVFQIDKAKIDWDTAKNSEEALLDGQVNVRLIQAQTALAKAKFNFLYREARRRHTIGHMQTHVIKTDRI
ncbi:YaaL family protein [Leuconostoc palmae]|uniref:YaaL family protein n=1 Tax=Leuconostoc palmae TaxID=501487 RepID=UPI001C7E15F5|nr:YaaL family protein [Leuconostoc palmae]